MKVSGKLGRLVTLDEMIVPQRRQSLQWRACDFTWKKRKTPDTGAPTFAKDYFALSATQKWQGGWVWRHSWVCDNRKLRRNQGRKLEPSLMSSRHQIFTELLMSSRHQIFTELQILAGTAWWTGDIRMANKSLPLKDWGRQNKIYSTLWKKLQKQKREAPRACSLETGVLGCLPR